MEDPTSVAQNCFNVLIHETQEIPGIANWSLVLYRSEKLITPPPSPGDHRPAKVHYCHLSREPTPENNPNPAAYLYYATGYAGNFRRKFYSNYYPFSDPNIKERIIVADDMLHLDWLDADRAIRKTPVNNSDPFYSSQLWVFDVLDEMHSMSLFHMDDFTYAHALLTRMHLGVDDMLEEMRMAQEESLMLAEEDD